MKNSSTVYIETGKKKLTVIQKIARDMLFRLLGRLRWGKVTVQDQYGQYTVGNVSDDYPYMATIYVYSPHFYYRILFGGSVGAAEAYIKGLWDADDLTTVMRIIAKNADMLEVMDGRFAILATPAYRIYHALRRNTKAGSKKNISEHYDLGEDFYRLFLDDTLTYSAGIFERPEVALRDASIAKYERICRKLSLGPDTTVLEIGTGWGGFALYAAQNFGCRITTATISDNQFDFANRLIREHGLSDKVTVLHGDYRDLSGAYDRLVSIEMIEAVGHQYLEEFFRVCSSCLASDGAMLLQAITITDQRYKDHTRSVDFIKRYIFPGSCLTSNAAMLDAAREVTDLRLLHLEDITHHYVLTLQVWRRRFLENLDSVRRLGFRESFIRMWEYYLAYCEGAFAERYIGDVQAVFVKPHNRMEIS